jgi:hypothetical protein
MSKRARIIWFGLAAVLVVAGGAVAALTGGTSTPGQVVGFVLIALGLMLATSLVFYEVGLSEDRERAREDRAREDEARKRERETRKREQSIEQPERPPRLRLPRSRGRRRRIT